MEGIICLALSMSYTVLHSDDGLSLLRDRLGDRDLLKGHCTKDLRQSKKFDELPGCCADEDESDDGGLYFSDEIIVT